MYGGTGPVGGPYAGPGGGLYAGPGGGLYTVPVTCQNETETTGIERYPDDDRTGRDQQRMPITSHRLTLNTGLNPRVGVISGLMHFGG
jgi:hypothetical protein